LTGSFLGWLALFIPGSFYVLRAIYRCIIDAHDHGFW